MSADLVAVLRDIADAEPLAELTGVDGSTYGQACAMCKADALTRGESHVEQARQRGMAVHRGEQPPPLPPYPDNPGELLPVEHLTSCPWARVVEILQVESHAMSTPQPTPVLLAQTGYDDETPVGLYTSREAAQVVIDQHDAAVRAAVADGKLGICHEGDLYVWDGPTDAPVAAFFDPGLYLWPYLPQTEAAPPAPGWDGSA